MTDVAWYTTPISFSSRKPNIWFNMVLDKDIMQLSFFYFEREAFVNDLDWEFECVTWNNKVIVALWCNMFSCI